MRLTGLLLLLAATAASAQPATGRRLTTLHALRAYPGYFHLQDVLLRGEFVERDGRLVLQSDTHEMRVRLEDGVRTGDGAMEVRARLIDVGRLPVDDPRAGREPLPSGAVESGLEPAATRWPRPGEDLFLQVTSAIDAEPAVTPSIRALALEPWKFAGREVTVTGNFRGRNLFGDLPDSPGVSRYDFVLRGAEGAVWVTGLRPRGRGFELDVNRRLDTDKWVEVTGTVAHDKGLVRLDGKTLALVDAPELPDVPEEPEEQSAAPPPMPVDIVFSSPTEGEINVRPDAPIRIQFSRGLDESTIEGNIRVTRLGAAPPAPGAGQPELTFTLSYDPGNNAVVLRFSEPLPPFSTVRVQILDGMRGFDGAPVTPWMVTFSVGG